MFILGAIVLHKRRLKAEASSQMSSFHFHSQQASAQPRMHRTHETLALRSSIRHVLSVFKELFVDLPMNIYILCVVSGVILCSLRSLFLLYSFREGFCCPYFYFYF